MTTFNDILDRGDDPVNYIGSWFDCTDADGNVSTLIFAEYKHLNMDAGTDANFFDPKSPQLNPGWSITRTHKAGTTRRMYGDMLTLRTDLIPAFDNNGSPIPTKVFGGVR